MNSVLADRGDARLIWQLSVTFPANGILQHLAMGRRRYFFRMSTNVLLIPRYIVSLLIGLNILACAHHDNAPISKNESRLILDRSRSLMLTCREIAPQISFYSDGNLVLCVRGNLTHEAMDMMDSAIGEDNFLAVADTGGGLGIATLEFAYKHLHKYDLIIDKCLSACAAYLFIGAKNKILFNDSFLGWHGAPPRTIEEYRKIAVEEQSLDSSWPNNEEEVKVLMVGWRKWQYYLKLQAKFFIAAGVDQSLIYDFNEILVCTLDSSEESSSTDKPNQIEASFYRPSLTKLENKYGLTNIYTQMAQSYFDDVIYRLNDYRIYETVLVPNSCL